MNYILAKRLVLKCYEKENNVLLSFELEEKLKDKLSQSDILQIDNDLFLSGFLTNDSKVLSNGGSMP